ncbi:hypothetical protein KKH39_02740 [Patescibacteria group bacterium]|nr:hypothetical protein [Patescibacteria group bacterium]
MKKLTILFALVLTLLALTTILVNRHEGGVYRLEVSGDSISDMVRRGNYDWTNSNINDDYFTADAPHEANIIIFKHFGEDMSTKAVLKALDDDGLRPATMSELLELGICYPELQKQFPIVALGSISQDPYGDRSVGFLYSVDGQRELGLDWIDDDWYDHFRFAAVRK